MKYEQKYRLIWNDITPNITKNIFLLPFDGGINILDFGGGRILWDNDKKCYVLFSNFLQNGFLFKTRKQLIDFLTLNIICPYQIKKDNKNE